MNLEFFPIQGGPSLDVELHLDHYQAGAQGRIYRANVGTDAGYCVKAMPDVSPGAVAAEVAALSKLISHIETSESRPGRPLVVKRALRAVRNNLPMHTCMSFIDGDTMQFLLLKRFVPGTSLQRLTQPSAPIPPIRTRYEVARRLAGSLTTLHINGCVHLDPYPDNILVDFDGGEVREVALIDLEGAGAIARDQNGSIRRQHDAFEREPSSYGKLGVWLLPRWYPRRPDPGRRAQPFADMYVAAAVWQMLAAVTFVLTWGLTPLAWLDRRSFQLVARAPSDVTITRAQLADASVRRDPAAEGDFAARLDCNSDLLHQLIRWFEASLLDPIGTPRAKEVQDRLAELCRL